MTLSELNRPFSLTPQLVANEPREALPSGRGVLTFGWTLLMSTKSAATGPLPACPPFAPWPCSWSLRSPSPWSWPGCSPPPSWPSAGAWLPDSRRVQPARASSPSGRSPTRSMAMAIRSRVAARLSFNGFTIALSAKPESCWICWAEAVSRW